MKKEKKSLLLLILCTVLVTSLFSTIPVHAASTIKCFLIGNKSEKVYSNTGLTKSYGTIYINDEIKVLKVTDKYSKVTYPTTKGKTKTGYIKTSAILTKTTGKTYTAKAKIVTYKKPSGASYGSIYKNDKVKILGTKGNYTQVKYPVSGGYKYAFVTTANANKYLKGDSKANVNNGMYVISTALKSNMVMDVKGGKSADGTNIQIFTSNGGTNQKFNITHISSGWYKIINVATNKAVDVTGGKKGPRVNVQQYRYNGTDAQMWRFISAGNGYYYIQNKLGYYLDVYRSYTANETNIQVYNYNGGNNQKWKLTATTASQKPSSNVSKRVNLSNALYKNSAAYISCGFDGYRNTKGRHEGIDIKYRNGAAVYSLTDGVITRVANGFCGSKGLSTIAIYNSATRKTVIYLHTAPVSGLRAGQSIKKGQKIATESWRGVSSSSGAHTHVEVRSGRQTYAAKSVNDPILNNANPTSFWNSMGYNIK